MLVRANGGALALITVLLLGGCYRRTGWCLSDNDCDPGFICSTKTRICILPSCTDGVKDSTETDVDCGGTCPACAAGQVCATATDCQTPHLCLQQKCTPPSCTDGVKDGTEAGVDCGGTCPACATGQDCRANADCQSALCTGTGVCQAPPLWFTSFEAGQPQGLTDKVEYSQNQSGAACAQVASPTHTGATAFQISATSTGTYSFVYCELVASPKFTIASGTRMRYWIYHTGVPTAAVDGLLSGGQNLREFNGTIIKDTHGIIIHPAYRQDPVGQWYYVEADLTPAAGQSFQYLMLAYDTGGMPPGQSYTGALTAVLDDLSFGP